MSAPLVTVIIPLQNNEQFIAQALRSVCRQTYDHLEIIVIDRGQSDHNKLAIQSFIEHENTKEKIQIVSRPNIDIPEALNHGLQLAKGEYLTILNAEDLYHSERLEKLVQKALQLNVHFIFTRVVGIEEDNRKAQFDHPWTLWYQNEMFNIIHSQTIESKFLTENIAVCAGNLFFSRALYESIGTFRHFQVEYTVDFIVRAMQAYEIYFFNEDLYSYRLYESHLKREGLHSNEKELQQIRLDYFVDVLKKNPSNVNAPSFTSSPSSFQFLRKRVQLNHLLESFVKKSEGIPTNEKNRTDLKLPPINQNQIPITLVTQDLAIGGGAPKLLLDMAKYLKTKGYRVQVFSLEDGPLGKEFESLNIPLQVVSKKLLQWTKKTGRIRRAFLLFKTVLFLNIATHQNIIINSAASWSFALPFTLFSPFKKIVWYIHESYSPVVYLNTGLVKKMLKQGILKNTFSFWFGSESTKRIWDSSLGVSGKVKYWSGIKNTTYFPEKQRPIKNILSIGTSHPRKGTHYLVDAFITCIQKQLIDKDVTLTIVGIPRPVDDFNGDLILKILANGLKDRVKLVSCISAQEIESYYREADLFVQASVLECLPLSLLQAMSVGLPILSTDVNGCKEAILHQETGYLCRPFSSLALVEGLTTALKNPEKTWEMGRKAQHSFNEKFSLDITMNEILKELSI